MNYIAYYRVSTKEQGHSGLGLESQQESVRRYISGTGGKLLKEFTDIASGSKDNRVNLNEAIWECQTHKAILVIKKLDRLSRGGFKIAVRLEELGIQYIESDSPNDNELLKNLKLAIAKDERQKISERTKAALAVLKNKGVKLGSPRNLTNEGRAKGAKAMALKKELNENNRRARAYAANLKANGDTLQSIADNLNGNGFQTSRGSNFNPIQVSRLLGCNSQQKTRAVIPIIKGASTI
ncbi:recombinase family protein [Ulvibacterium marinum]|uniref:Recombinase family protein n=1 Tax=Ulvibacterium marinum TaxID=2419782 RepID=A0A3B0CE83_9FLAO|nr:recombinase family protein [Ulvibacterium marinum]RKN83351.1 recombinase family protein [Ulvibacterium marinum]